MTLKKSKKRKSGKKIALSPLDREFSRYIRTRDRWTCQKCGTVYPEGSQGLHCSHVFSRRHKAIRWEPLNAKALCFSCHQWYGGNPTESAEWVKAYLGAERFAELERMKAQTVKDNEGYRQECRGRIQELMEELDC